MKIKELVWKLNSTIRKYTEEIFSMAFYYNMMPDQYKNLYMTINKQR